MGYIPLGSVEQSVLMDGLANKPPIAAPQLGFDFQRIIVLGSG